MPSRPFLLTALLLSAGMALFGSATPLSKLVVEQLPVFTASLFRVVVGALVIGPFLGGKFRAIRTLTRRDWVAVGAIALVGMFGFTALLLYGMRLVPGVVGAIVMSAAPAVTAAGSVLFLSDRWNRRKMAAIVLAVAGVVIVNLGGTFQGQGPGGSGGAGTLLIGSVLVLGAVCCEAAFTLIGKVATERLEPLLTVFLASALAVPLFLATVVTFELGAFHAGAVRASGWLAVLAWGGGTLGLGSLLWYKGLQETKGTVAAGFMGVMPVSALVLSYILLSEPVRLIHLVGFAIVFAGVLVISREHARGDDGEDGTA